MTYDKHFDLLTSPLEGTNLIEASAGTGKTYTIAGLFVRLLLEKNVPVEQILVVTFTEAATGELKGRIRQKLRHALEAFENGWSEDCFLNELVQRQRDSAAAVPCLREALQAFDLASIFTIHGFCLRTLRDNAFESGALFDTELITDQEQLKRQIVEDFWRRHFYHASPLFIQYAMSNGFRPGRFAALLGNKATQPHLKIIPRVGIADTSRQERDYAEGVNRVRESWQAARMEVEDILAHYDGLNRNKYRKKNIPVWISAMEQFLSSGAGNATLFKGFDKFTSSELEVSVKGGHSPPAHRFFELCEQLRQTQRQLLAVFEQRLLGLKAELFHFVRAELSRRKDEKNVQSFDDLLVKLERALAGEGGQELARVVRMKFKAALIDEFQDTDPVQYTIFRGLFAQDNGILFLIGDPKQAIYGFRGADIFAYMEAARQVEHRYTLAENWRSEPRLVSAINTIFANREQPFLYRDIEYHLAIPAERREADILRLDGETGQPLQLWFLDAGEISESGKPITKGRARELIPRAVAAEISRLLSLSRKGRAFLGEEPLQESDIAVLVRTNAEARLMQEALSVYTIPSVLYSTESLFDSHEAMEVERILTAIAEPHDERFLKAALVTDMIGVNGEALDQLLEENTKWDNWLIAFRDYHNLWNDRGFMVMFRHLLAEQTVLPRLMSLPGGERRSTNMLHLSEVLHQASMDRKLGMSGLLKWLAEQRVTDTRAAEEHQLRLESDETAVKLVTVHKSKGLEYPIVFCPFTWDGSRLRRATDPFMFHDEEDDMRLTLDLGSPERDRHRLLAEKELLAENVRLLYVALTRAMNRCYLVWGRFRAGETSAPAYLFHCLGSAVQGDVVNATAERFSGLSDRDMLSELTAVRNKAREAIRLADMPPEPGEEYVPPAGHRPVLSCRKFSGSIDRQWHISSYSSLVSGKAYQAELGDRDAIDLADRRSAEGVTADDEVAGMFSFPKGAKAGTFLHDVFEHLDFPETDNSAMQILVLDKLKEYGFESTWQETVCDAIRKVLTVPLESGRRDFTLSCIENKARLNELEFYFPLKPISPQIVQRLLADCADPELSSDFPRTFKRLEFAPVRGFMKGFIDMVFQFQDRFYLVDWKSNFLGGKVEDYSQPALAAAMHREFYVLQYHLYSVALHQYLRVRLPDYSYDKHFGAVYYIFLRGVDPDRGPDYGIYRDRPPKELIELFCEKLIDNA